MAPDTVDYWHVLDAVSFGRWIRAERESRRLQQKELASVAGIATSSLSSIESGKRKPSLSVATRLATSLDQDPGSMAEQILAASKQRGEAAAAVAVAASAWLHAVGDQPAFEALLTAVRAWEAID